MTTRNETTTTRPKCVHPTRQPWQVFDSFIATDCLSVTTTPAAPTTIPTTTTIDPILILEAIIEQIHYQEGSHRLTTSPTTTQSTVRTRPTISDYSDYEVVDLNNESFSYQFVLPSVVQFSNALTTSSPGFKLPELALVNDYLVKLSFFGNLLFMQILDDNPQVIRQNRVTHRFHNRMKYLAQTRKKRPQTSIHRIANVRNRSRRGLPNPFGPLVQTDITAEVSTANKHNVSIVEVGPNGTITHNNYKNETKEGKVETSNVSHGSTVTVVRGNGNVDTSKSADPMTVEYMKFLMNGLSQAVSIITTTRTTTTTIRTTTTTTTTRTTRQSNVVRHSRHGRYHDKTSFQSLYFRRKTLIHMKKNVKFVIFPVIFEKSLNCRCQF